MKQSFDYIYAVSLESHNRHVAAAVYDGSKLAITHCTAITGPASKWRDNIINTIKTKSEEGHIVLVEDRTHVFCVGDSSPFSFEDMYEGRSMLFNALDWYFAMLNLGQIIADKEVERFLIRSGAEGQKIEKTQDDKGRTVYKVDWASIGGGTKAVLMCVVGAIMQPLSNRYLDAMYGSIEEDEEPNPLSIWEAITHGVDQAEIKKWNKFYND